jgi:hypothetical protein
VNALTMMISGYAGWVGALATMGAYGLVSQGRLDANSGRYQAVNVVGAALLAVSALSADNWPSLAANLAWMLIALLSLRRAPGRPAHGFAERARGLRAHVARAYPLVRSLGSSSFS